LARGNSNLRRLIDRVASDEAGIIQLIEVPWT
jgi:hypothetical protein